MKIGVWNAKQESRTFAGTLDAGGLKMQEPRIPEILKTKLVFGDLSQIKALREYEADCFKYFGDGTERTYNVHISVEYDETVQVQAGSELEAEKKARDDFDGFGLAYDTSFNAEPVDGDC